MSVDTLIIGSGVAAAAISTKLLAKNPQSSILMLEAGTKVKMRDAAIWQDYVVSGKLPYTQYWDDQYPQRDHPGENVDAGKTSIPLNGARVFTYGGSTIHWGGWSFRLKPEDFKLQSGTGRGIDWPFDYPALEPWYSEAEHYIGVAGDSNDPTVPRSKGYPFPAYPFTLQDEPMATALKKLDLQFAHLPIARHGISDSKSRHAPCQTTGTCKYCPFGARFSANNYLDDMVNWGNFPNLEIRLNCVVQKINMSSKSHAASVEYTDTATGQQLTVEANRIIIAAGTIESAKVLLRSRSEYWKDGIGNDADLVGRNIVTHPYFIFAAKLPSNPKRLQPEMDFPTLVSRHFDSPAEQQSGKFVLINPPSSPTVSLKAQMLSGQTRDSIDRNVTGSAQIQIHGMVEVFSNPENRIANTDKLNHMGLRETLVDYSQDAAFNIRMQQIQAHVEQIFRAMGAIPSGDPPSISWRADHASCTARMSADPATGVTDPDLLVHGTDNLFVCSNAAFPNTGSINPTLTLTALALRLGHHLSSH
jgi:choline dehydrogenase-like flavoprotein